MAKLVRVTWEEIASGIPNEEENCPVALALRRDGTSWMVDTNVIIQNVITGDELAEIDYKLSKELEEWIDRFDVGLPVKPITLTIDKIRHRIGVRHARIRVS